MMPENVEKQRFLSEICPKILSNCAESKIHLCYHIFTAGLYFRKADYSLKAEF